MRWSFAIHLILAAAFADAVFGADPYSVIEALIPRDKLPRVLNTVDWKIDADRPLPHATIADDFNGDGRLDLAISGVFGTPGGGPRFFLLVAAENAWKTKRHLHYEEAHDPYFLHAPGTTGPADPGDQSFSTARCADCDSGVDYYWDADESRFRTVMWSRPLVAPPREDRVSIPEAEMALQVVGRLEDVRDLVSRVETNDEIDLVTRAVPGEGKTVWIVISTRNRDDETIYDRILVDLGAGTVLERERDKQKGK